ncbi:MAG: arginine biosynthesis protein ArgJ [Megasphaera sp.]|jgi:glutamate N-acetyltransferase/amino-acid N-acetyltransferase|nr:arginine biosynthesis protein ArgJ [Megasphaera sp.]MCI1247564.1 arginine biosynthesis protein ArgJ [Megasphaera sp.]
MKQEYDDICIPKGFSAAGTYSGLCKKRVKLDLAMIVSQNDCSIVTACEGTTTCTIGKTLVLHNGTALPEGERGKEVQKEVCRAVSKRLGIPSYDITVGAYGDARQYFKPSLLINSLSTLTAGLSSAHGGQVGMVIDNNGDISGSTVPFCGDCHMSGIAADGMEGQAGLCIITTDVATSPQQIEKALTLCHQMMDLEEFRIIVMSNGAATHSANAAELAQAMQQLFKELGFQDALQACS